MALEMPWKKTVLYVNPENQEDILENTKKFPRAYILVVSYDGEKNYAHFVVHVYSDKTKKEHIDTLLYTMRHNVSNNSDNIIKQAYIYLKTLPEFANAIDC